MSGTYRPFRDEAGKRTKFGTRRTNVGPILRPPKPVESIGSRPRARFAGSLPPSPEQGAVLAQLKAGKTSAQAIGEAIGRSNSSVNASLYALADRGLVERVPWKGWRLR